MFDIDAVRAACDRTVAGIMPTNPNTLGLFEEHIEEVVRIVHDRGGLVYGDGANMNALAGIARPGDLGFDVMHFNLHKTFATPHGGGGPGAGPVGVSARLADFLPGPVIEAARGGSGDARYLLGTPKKSIGQVSTFFGNFGMFVRAYTYIRRHGGEGLRANSEHAVLNANYLRVKLAILSGCRSIGSTCMNSCARAPSRAPAYGRWTSASGCSTPDSSPPTDFFR